MLIRMAIFDGVVKQGQEGAMRSFVEAELAPLWRQFTGAVDVKVLFGVEQDPNGPQIPCILQVTYPDQAAIETAMESPARHKSRDMLPAFYDQFFERVRLYHYLMEV